VRPSRRPAGPPGATEPDSGGSPAPLRGALEAMEVALPGLAGPILLKVLTGLSGIVAMALWLPLLHIVLTGQLRLGRRFQVFESLLPQGADRGTLLAVLAGGILLATVGRSALAYWAERAVAERSGAAERTLAEKIVRRHLRFGQHYYDAVGTARTARNLQQLPARAARLVPWLARTASSCLELVLLALLMAWLAPALAAVALVVLTVYYFGLRRLVERAEARAGEVEDLEDEAGVQVQDLAANFLLVRLHTPEEEAVGAFRQRADRRAEVGQRRRSLLRLVREARQGANVLVLLAFVLALGWMLQHVDGAAVSRYLVFFFVLRRSMGSFSALQGLPRQWQGLRRRLREVDRLLAGDEQLVPSGSRPVTAVREGLEVRSLDFAYGAGEPVLRGVSLAARRGEMTVLVGPNGSGKSTLVELVLRLYDVPPGSLFLDGVDLRELDIGSLRRRCGYAGPEPLLLDASLRENLTVGLGEVPEARLWEAAEVAGIATLVRGLEGGFEHPVGSRGLRLSQGERQRLALTRLLVRDPDLVLLDEAISSLDPESEAEVMARLAELAAQRVVLAVTHRVPTIPRQAQVVVLDRGEVVEAGRCGELLERPGHLRRLVRASVEGERRERPVVSAAG
jgi:ABC-type multidrug transport system fused ATPase/permease subunit